MSRDEDHHRFLGLKIHHRPSHPSPLRWAWRWRQFRSRGGKSYSDTGNRTPGYRVRGDNVSHYTISDYNFALLFMLSFHSACSHTAFAYIGIRPRPSSFALLSSMEYISPYPLTQRNNTLLLRRSKLRTVPMPVHCHHISAKCRERIRPHAAMKG